MALNDLEIVLITGGNTGLGFEIARKLLRDHSGRFYVLIGARTPSKGEAAVKQLHEQGWTDSEFIHIDITNDDSITGAAKAIESKFGRLDAGIAPDKDMLGHLSLSATIMTAMQTNAAGSAQTVETFIPLLQKAQNPRIIFMSTGLGSLSLCAKPNGISNQLWPAYASSKAAMNMIMIYFWQKFPEMRINACSPGFRATALNNFGQGAPPGLKAGSAEDGAKNAVRLTLIGKDGENGTHTMMDDQTDEVNPVAW